MKKFLKKQNFIFLYYLPIIAWILVFLTKPFLIGDIIVSFLPYLIIINIAYFIITLIILKPFESKEYISKTGVALNLTFIILNLFWYLSFYKFQNLNDFDNGIKVFSANIYYYNENMVDLAADIQKEDPDFVILIEVTQKHEDVLETNTKDILNFKSKRTPGFATNIIYSKHELIDSKIINISNNQPGFIHAKYKIENSIYNVIAIHTAAPLSFEYFDSRNLYLDELSSYINSIDKNEKIIVTGDFNLAPWSNYYSEFDSGIDLKNASASNTPQMTWGVLNNSLASHIDHTWYSNNLNLKGFKSQNIKGSDHKALITNFE